MHNHANKSCSNENREYDCCDGKDFLSGIAETVE